MKKTIYCAGALMASLWISFASAVELKFVTPDGQPATGIKVYRWYHGTPIGGTEMMGMGDMMGMEMESGAGYAGDMGDGGYGEMSMGMYGSPTRMNSDGALVFLNGQSWSLNNKGIGDELAVSDDGTVVLEDESLESTRGTSVHSDSLLAIHSTGISYIPAGTKFTSTSQLRSLVTIVVDPPEGVDTSKFKVVTCWQSGFAIPSYSVYQPLIGMLDSYDMMGSLGMGEYGGDGMSSMTDHSKQSLDPQDWRFKPQFRIFQTARLGEPISVPPGEVRVSIVPDSVQPGITNTLPSDLLDSVLAGGPSTIVLAASGSKTLLQVRFPSLRSLVCRIPIKSEDGLPDWGDDSHGEYYLHCYKRIAASDTVGLTSPPANALTSTSAFSDFLNRHRDERADFQSIRLPSSVTLAEPDVMTVRFDLLRPGWYTVVRKDVDGGETRGISILEIVHGEQESIAHLANGKVEDADNGIQLAVDEDGRVRFRSVGPPQPAPPSPGSPSPGSPISGSLPPNSRVQAGENERSDDERLKLAQSLRNEIEETIHRLTAQRSKLLELEATIQQSRSPQVQADPFGGPTESAVDPFGSSGPSPFGSDDPFGN